MLDAADIQFRIGADYKGKLPCFPLTDICKSLIVNIVSLGHRLDRFGILVKRTAHDTHHGSRFFDIIRRPGQDDHVTFISLLLHESQRDRIGDAAVQKFLTSDFYNA